MTRKIYSPAGKGFLAGILFSLILIGMYSFSVPSGSSAPGLTPVSVSDANVQFQAYRSRAVASNQVLSGFTLDKVQVEAMNSILRENASVAGFRVYLGTDRAGQRTAIVVGTDNNGRDAVGSTIYSTVSVNCNACPPVCDVNSPITAN